MRVWTVHPSELDRQRILAQHREIHGMLGTMKAQYRKDTAQSIAYTGTEGAGEVIKRWGTPHAIAGMILLHDLIVDDIFVTRQYNHHSPILLPQGMWNIINPEFDKYDYLFTTPIDRTISKWPPEWITVKEKISDIMDLQYRWPIECKFVELGVSIALHGAWPGGTPSGDHTDVSTITDDQVERYLNVHSPKKSQV